MNFMPPSVTLPSFLQMKYVFPWPQSNQMLSSLSPAWVWLIKRYLPVSPNNCSSLTVGNIPPLPPSFSTASSSYSIPMVDWATHWHILSTLQRCCKYGRVNVFYGPIIRWYLPINPQRCSYLTVGRLSPTAPSFSTANSSCSISTADCSLDFLLTHP